MKGLEVIGNGLVWRRSGNLSASPYHVGVGRFAVRTGILVCGRVRVDRQTPDGRGGIKGSLPTFWSSKVAAVVALNFTDIPVSKAGSDAQHKLKRALLEAYFTQGENPSNHAVLLDAVERAGLDRTGASEIVGSDEVRNEVRQSQQLYISQGINSVPAVIINQRYLVQGGQPVEVFEGALRQAAAET